MLFEKSIMHRLVSFVSSSRIQWYSRRNFHLGITSLAWKQARKYGMWQIYCRDLVSSTCWSLNLLFCLSSPIVRFVETVGDLWRVFDVLVGRGRSKFYVSNCTGVMPPSLELVKWYIFVMFRLPGLYNFNFTF